MLTIDDYRSDGYDTSKRMSHYDKYTEAECKCKHRHNRKGKSLPIFRSFIQRRFDNDTASKLFAEYSARYYEDKGTYIGLWNHFRDFVHTDFDLTFGYTKSDFLMHNKVITEMLTLGIYVKHLKIAMFRDLRRYLRFNTIQNYYQLPRDVIFKMLKNDFIELLDKIDKMRSTSDKGLSYSNLRCLIAIYEIYDVERALLIVNDLRFKTRSKDVRVRRYPTVLDKETRAKVNVTSRVVNDEYDDEFADAELSSTIMDILKEV